MRKIIFLTLCLCSSFLYSQETVTLYITDGNDDAYQLYRPSSWENPTGEIFVDSDKLFVGNSFEPTTYYQIGLRYLSVPIPKGSVIESAFVQFYSYEASTDTVGIRVYCERSPNPLTFTNTEYNISDRVTTYADEYWVASEWQAFIPGINSRTHDIKRLIQEVVNMDEWVENSPMVFLFKGTNPGHGADYPKCACSWEFGGEFYAPVLTITYVPSAGVEEEELAKSLNIFPNPVIDKFTLSFKELKEGEYSISLLDLQGRKVHEVYSGLLANGDHQFNVSADELKLEQGIYLLSIQNTMSNFSQKIIIR